MCLYMFIDINLYIYMHIYIQVHAALQASPHDARAVLEQAVTELLHLSRQAAEHAASSPQNAKRQTPNAKP